MPALADIQSAFIDALRRPDLPVPDAIGRKHGEPAKRRFDVYRNNVAAGMTEALRATYPAVETLVGAEFFAASARVYLDQDPPRSPLLFRHGGGFGAFLDSFPPAASTPYLGDVARLEWARLQAYHARDCDPLSIDALNAFINGEGDVTKLRFQLHPSLTLIRSRWPVVSLWAASTGLGASDDVDMKRPEQALVVRPVLDVDTRQVSEGGFVFLSALETGVTLEQAAARALEADNDFDLAAHLQGVFSVGGVAAIIDSPM